MNRYLRSFGELFGISDISMHDISHPSSERLILFASAIVNWIRFQEQALVEELEQWNGIADKGEQAKARRAEVSG